MKPLALPLPFEFPAARAQTARALKPVPTPAAKPQEVPRRRAAWLAIHLPQWSLHASLATLDSAERAKLSAKPVAVVDGDRRATVIALNEAAASLGVRLGHSLNAAIALSADMTFLPRATGKEVDLLREIAAICEQYTSAVSLQPPNELLLEVRGSLRLFGGLAALIQRISKDFEQRGFAPQMAVSATAQSALWIARSTRESKVVAPRELIAVIGKLPVSTLHWPMDVELRLARFGVMCIGDLLRLPRGGLARRIGREYLTELDRAVGRHPDVRRHFRSPDTYEDLALLDFEIETTALLETFIVRRLERLQRFLVRRDLALDAIHIELHHRDHPHTQVALGLASASSDMSHLAQLLHEHLARLQLPAPVTAFSVRIDRLQPARHISSDLFPTTPSSEAVAERARAQARLLEQLRSRLGEAAIVQLLASPDHRPERAHSEQPPCVENQRTTSAAPLALLAPRPLWLLREPRRLRAATLRSNHAAHRVGPEKIEGGWWDDQLVVRDYYRAPSPQGALAWLYRDQACAGEWHLHGLFG